MSIEVLVTVSISITGGSSYKDYLVAIDNRRLEVKFLCDKLCQKKLMITFH